MKFIKGVHALFVFCLLLLRLQRIFGLTLMYYTNFVSFMENPNQDEMKILAERENPPPKQPSLFD